MKKYSMIENIFNLLLICCFVGCSFFILLLGVNSYQKSNQSVDAMNQLRIPISYLTSKVRQANSGSIEVTKIQDSNVLLIHEKVDDTLLVTAIYYQDGYLYENYSLLQSLDLSNGTKLVPLSSFELNVEKDCLTIDVCNVSDQCQSINFSLNYYESNKA